MNRLSSILSTSLLISIVLSVSALPTVQADETGQHGMRIDCELPNDRHTDGTPSALAVVYTGRKIKAGWVDLKKGEDYLGSTRATRDGATYIYGFQIVTKSHSHGCQIGIDTTTTFEKIVRVPLIAMLYPPLWLVFGPMDDNVSFRKQVTEIRFNSVDPAHSEVLIQHGLAEQTTRLTRTGYEMDKVESHAAVCRAHVE